MKTILFLTTLFFSVISWGQMLIPNATPVTQNFDGMLTVVGTLPTGFRLNTTPNYSTGTSVTTEAGGTSGVGVLTSTSSGGAYNFANGVNASATDRALGFLNTGAASASAYTGVRYILLEIQNTSTNVLVDLTVSFDYEKYRLGTRAYDMTFYHGSLATLVTTSASSGDQNYPSSGGNTVVNPTTTIAKSFTINNVNVPISGKYYLCWKYLGVGGDTNAQALGIDNLVLTGAFCNFITTWSGSAWDNGTPDNTTTTKKAVFNGAYTVIADADICSCQVNSGAVNVATGKTLKINGRLDVLGGSLTFDDGASLLQTSTVTNTASINYKRTTKNMLRYDFTYWSSPVVSQNLNAVSPATLGDKFFSYDPVTDNWSAPLVSTSITMTVGKGYIIRAPQTHNISGTKLPYTATFTGIPNNGSLTTPIAGTVGVYNLIGNPYPSAMSADAFLLANNVALEGTIYLWTHNTAPALLNYDSGDYASYNTTGGTGTTMKAPNTGINNTVPTGKIAAGQSFFVAIKATSPTTATFNNTMRQIGGVTIENSEFFRMSSTTKKTTAIEKNRVWLNMSNTTGAFRQTLLGYVTGATNGIDSAFDGPNFSASTIDFYSINDSKNLVIQGRALPFDTADEVPLGYSSTTAGDFTISIDQTDGLLANQDIFLEDKVTGTTQNLRDAGYNFTTDTGTFDTRFVLKYTNATLGTNTIGAKENKVIVSAKNKQIKINATNETLDKVTIYDVSGKRIYQKANIGTSELLISNINSSQTVLIVKTTLKNGQTSSDKVLF
jgi:hypothetical protein